jgi:hypothetical protein
VNVSHLKLRSEKFDNNNNNCNNQHKSYSIVHWKMQLFYDVPAPVTLGKRYSNAIPVGNEEKASVTQGGSLWF